MFLPLDSIWLLYLTDGLRSSILANLTPYVTSNFQSHSLLTVIGIVSDSMTSAVYIPMAKLLDIWGRAEGFLLMVASATLGTILMAASHNLATFCAAQVSWKPELDAHSKSSSIICLHLFKVFYSVGFSGIIYCVDVSTADVTSIRNRGLAFAFTSSPYMITAFAGSKAAEAFYNDVSWRWGFGCFAIIVPGVTLPIFAMLKINQRKAEKQGIFVREKSGRTLSQNVWHYIKEFDSKLIYPVEFHSTT